MGETVLPWQGRGEGGRSCHEGLARSFWGRGLGFPALHLVFLRCGSTVGGA